MADKDEEKVAVEEVGKKAKKGKGKRTRAARRKTKRRSDFAKHGEPVIPKHRTRRGQHD